MWMRQTGTSYEAASHYVSFMFSLLLSPCPLVRVLAVVCLSRLSHRRSPPPLDYAEQLRLMQKTKDKLELALETHQDCTYLLSPPASLLLSSVSHHAPLHPSFLYCRR